MKDDINKELSQDQLLNILNESYETLFQLRRKKASGEPLNNPAEFGFHRNRIAQVKTVLRQKSH